MRFQIRIGPFWRPVFFVLGAPRRSLFVDVDEAAGTLRVKFGIWFDETFAISEVEEVRPSTFPWYGGLGVKLGPGNAVSVVGSGDGVVAVHFARPQPMRVLINVSRPELRISLEDPEGFMRALPYATS